MNVKEVHERIDRDWEQGIELAKELIAQKSISATGEGIQECAEKIRGILENLGADAQVIQSKGNPYILAEIKSSNPNAPTLMLLNHYDVQPIGDRNAWNTDPFEGTVIDGVLYGRGASDNKGQFAANVTGVKAWMDTYGSLPVNIKFLLEGEEELGSPSFESFVMENQDLLHGDVIFFADAAIHESGAPNIFYGVRGSLAIRLKIKTAGMDHHSGNKGGIIPDASWQMVELLSSMKNPDGTVAIEGFYDDIIPPSETDWQMIDNIPFDPVEIKKNYMLYSDITMSKREYYKHLMFLPNMTISGLQAGTYSDTSFLPAIPGSASAIINIRFPLAQTPEKLFEVVKKHVEKINPDAEVEYIASGRASRSDTSNPMLQTISGAVERIFERPAVQMPSLGSSWGAEYLFTQILKMPCMYVPYANTDENNHSPNENFKVDYFKRGAHVIAEVIGSLGDK